MLFPYSKKIPHTGERFFINCTDIGKFEGELENFPGTDWPECVVGCVDFPEMDNFKPKEKFYKLPNDTIEYECSKLGLVPHTGAEKNISNSFTEINDGSNRVCKSWVSEVWP